MYQLVEVSGGGIQYRLVEALSLKGLAR